MSGQLDALRAFMTTRPAAAAAAAAPHSNVCVVGSGKGGSGTSTVAALVALAAASLGRRTLLVDADPFVGPLRLLLGAAPAATLADLRAGAPVERVVTPVSATLSLIAGGPAAGGPGVAGAFSLGITEPAEQRLLLRRLTTHYPAHDLIVVDGGSRLDSVCACCDTGGSLPARLLVVTGTDPIALASSYALVKAVGARTAARPGGPVSAALVVNRHDEAAATVAATQLGRAARDFLGAEAPLAGAVPDDLCLDVALRSGMPVQDAAAGSPAAVAAHAIAERLLAQLDPSGRTSPRPTARPSASLSPALALGAPR